MLEKIIAHTDHYRGPAQGIGTEHGDSWPVAVTKINAAIDAINGADPQQAASGGMTPPEEIGNIVQAALQPLQDEINNLRREVEVANAKAAIAENNTATLTFLEGRIAAVEGFFDQPAPQPGDPNLPPPPDEAPAS